MKDNTMEVRTNFCLAFPLGDGKTFQFSTKGQHPVDLIVSELRENYPDSEYSDKEFLEMFRDYGVWDEMPVKKISKGCDTVVELGRVVPDVQENMKKLARMLQTEEAEKEDVYPEFILDYDQRKSESLILRLSFNGDNT